MLEVYTQVEFQRISDELADLPHKVCEPFELKSDDLWDSLQECALDRIGFHEATLAVVFVVAVELIDSEVIL